MKIESIIDLVGNTPLLKVNNIINNHNLKANLYVKLEMFNFSGSVKIRIVKYIIMDGLRRGIIKPYTKIVEASSGNVGIALACICARLGLDLTIVMPESVSEERKQLIKVYGAKLILTPSKSGMKGALDKVKEMVEGSSDVFVLSQFTNKLNPLAHQKTTAVEIYDDLDGKVDIVVSGIGSGGTITGISDYLHMVGDTYMIGVEPVESPLISKGIFGFHKIEGIGANFIPDILTLDSIDRMEMVSYDDSLKGISILAKEEGVFVGISSGAAFTVAYNEALKPENYDKNIVVILPDSGERYLSRLKDENI